MNRVILIGRLTADPSLRYTSTGVAVVTFTLAVDRQFKNDQGKRETDFIRCKAWRKLAEVVAQNLQKGRLIAVDGRLNTWKSTGQDGTTQYGTDVVAENVQFLDYPKEQRGGQSENYGPSAEDDSDSLPF